MQSQMVHNFGKVPQADIQRSTFDRSASYKTVFNAGVLVPIFWDIAYPGDTFNMNMTVFARLATPIKPFMDNLRLESFWFSVPIRLLWSHWQNFCGEQVNPTDTTVYTVPQATFGTGGVGLNKIADYLGLPIGKPGLSVMAFPFRAYLKCFDEWFRDQNLQSSVFPAYGTGDGPDVYEAGGELLRRCKRPDYFTSALPWPQKGTAPALQTASVAPVVSTGGRIAFKPFAGGNDRDVSLFPGGTVTYANPLSTADLAAWGAETGLQANIQLSSPVTINEFRQAFQIQRLLERDARSGTRYKEVIKAHFGVDHPDLNWRPEYLGGGTSYVNVHPLAQTSGSPADTGYTDTPQGNLAAFGTVSGSNHGFSKSFTEHCIVLGMVQVNADLSYQQGVERQWSYKTRYDFYWPVLSHLGEQPIYNKEIYFQGNETDDGIFGYQERYAEAKYRNSLVTAQMKSDAGTSLDIWHLAQDFSALPVLNDSFIQDNPPIERVIAVPEEKHFILDAFFKLRCARPMPLYSVPGMVDHF